jgi:hypothetical protein
MEVLLLRPGGVLGGCLPSFYRLIYLESQRASRHGEIDADIERFLCTPIVDARVPCVRDPRRREDDPEAETRASQSRKSDRRRGLYPEQ